MKIIHTSDWHLGKDFENDIDRTEEYLHFFGRLGEIIRRENPDALLVSGDIFNQGIPPASARKLYTDGILSLKKACPKMDVIIIAGNHDSPSQIEAEDRLWEIAGVHVIGRIGRESDIAEHSRRHIIPIGDMSSTKGYVIAVPFCYQRNYPLLDGCTDQSDREKVFLEALVKEAGKVNSSGLPVVMMMHTTIKGSDYSEKGSIGGIETLDADSFSAGVDYFALGHIHNPQTIGKARYCGSPIPIDFAEEYSHGVSIVDIPSRGSAPSIKIGTIQPLVQVLTVPPKASDVDDAIKAVKDLPDVKAFVRVLVKCDGFIPSPQQKKIREAVPYEGLKICQIVPVKENVEKKTFKAMSASQLEKADPIDIARSHYESKFGKELPEDLKSMLTGIISEAKSGN